MSLMSVGEGMMESKGRQCSASEVAEVSWECETNKFTNFRRTIPPQIGHFSSTDNVKIIRSSQKNFHFNPTHKLKSNLLPGAGSKEDEEFKKIRGILTIKVISHLHNAH
jgi:hypothetical protein